MPVTSLERVQAAALTHILARAPNPSCLPGILLAVKQASRFWAEGTIPITYHVHVYEYYWHLCKEFKRFGLYFQSLSCYAVKIQKQRPSLKVGCGGGSKRLVDEDVVVSPKGNHAVQALPFPAVLGKTWKSHLAQHLSPKIRIVIQLSPVRSEWRGLYCDLCLITNLVYVPAPACIVDLAAGRNGTCFGAQSCHLNQ